jgi:hypothetical protein
VLSITLVARGGGWGGSIPVQKTDAYLLDRASSATMLTIPFGHTLAALRDVLGEIVELSSVLATRRTTAIALDTGETLPVTAPDQVLVSGVLENRAPVSIHYRGGSARGGDGLLWEINGTEGDIRVTGSTGHSQMVRLSLAGGRGNDKALRPIEVPEDLRTGWPDNVVPGNVARVYARMAADLRDGTRTAPTFEDAWLCIGSSRRSRTPPGKSRRTDGYGSLSASRMRKMAALGRGTPPQQIIGHGHGEDRIGVRRHLSDRIDKGGARLRIVIDHLLVECVTPGGFVRPFGIADEPPVGITVQA